MNFVQLEFLGFLIAVLVLHWVGRTARWQNTVLLVASAVFYGWVHPWWVVLLYASSLVDFTMARLMVRAPARKRWWLAITLTANIGLLAYFKYLGFLVDNTVAALNALGVEAHPRTLNILLPAGISFYTFQTMSYVIDVYRGELQPRKDLLDYFLFVSYFPQLVAGPIERATRLLPQLEGKRTFAWDAIRAGTALAMWGGFKKMVIADTLAPYVDKVYVLDEPAAPLLWAATFGFMVQIYADFSGYTDIARGVSRMFGVELMRNFDEPYLAATTPEFWQRWHISLSSWIRDYLMAPLLGDVDVVTPQRFLAAITVTMVVMGAWHGAGWNFVIFGVYHAFWIGFYAWVGRRLPERVRALPGGRALAVAFHLVVVGGVGMFLFRESSVERIAWHLGRNPFVADTDAWRATLGLLGVTTALAVPFVVEHVARRAVLPRLEASPWYLPIQTTTWALFAVAMGIFYRVSAYDFIYFQF